MIEYTLDDPRVAFNKTTQKYFVETDDGEEYEYNVSTNSWNLSESRLAKEQQKVYEIQGVDQYEPTAEIIANKKKRRKNYTGFDEEQTEANERPTRAKNTAVYVTGLPIDASVEEISMMFQKCGVIAEDAISGQKRIKLYQNGQGENKGDALIVFFKEDSVRLAEQLLDDTAFRPGNVMKISVQQAEFRENPNPTVPKQRTQYEKRRLQAKRQKLERLSLLYGSANRSKLADWEDDDVQSNVSNRWAKVVILKHMFTLDELVEDPSLLLDLKQDIREECEKIGRVTNVVLFDREAEGVVSVRFSNEDDARSCQETMNGRFFAGQSVEADIYDGKLKYQKTRQAEDEDTRLDKFGDWLEDDREDGNTK